MILLICLWQQNILQSLLAFASWGILHWFFTFSLSHITVTGHIGGCCERQGARVVGPCRQQMVESVRALLDFTHSLVIPIWSMFLLGSEQYDIEAHAFLYVTSLGYHSYATYWNMKDVTQTNRGHFHQHGKPLPSRRSAMFRLVQSILSVCLVVCSMRAVSMEMARWRNQVVPLLLDLHPSTNWSHRPTNTQRKALSHHLLTKSSDITWLLTLFLAIHEAPNLFSNGLRLFRLSTFTNGRANESSWTNEKASAAALGAAAWRREKGINIHQAGGLSNQHGFELALAAAYRFTFVFVRTVGGFAALHHVLSVAALIRDTSYVTVALLQYGIALYICGSVITKATSIWKQEKENLPRKSLSWQIAQTMDENIY